MRPAARSKISFGSESDTATTDSFLQGVSDQRRRVLGLGALDKAPLSRGVDALNHAHQWTAPIELTTHPLLFFTIPSIFRPQQLRADDFFFIPYGWDSSFGGAFTISVMHRKLGWLGRAYLRNDDPILKSFEEPAFCAVFVKSNVPVFAIEVTFLASSRSTDDYRENWYRAKTHQAFIHDDVALFWDVARFMPNVVTGLGLRPDDHLSLGWVKRYCDVLVELRRVLTALAHMPTIEWPSDADIPSSYINLVRFLKENPKPKPGDITQFVTNVATRSHEELLALMLQEYHDFAHSVVGEHSPLCALARVAFDLHLWSSASTRAGRRVPVLRNGCITYLDLNASGFPESCSPKDYWMRVPRLPAEWGFLVQGTDFPIDLGKESSVWANMPAAADAGGAVEAAHALIDEALADRKWTIPPEAILELPYGSFTHMQLGERSGEIEFVLRSATGEFSSGGLNLSSKHMWWEAIGAVGGDQQVRINEISSGLYLLVAATVRDFFVVDERERIFRHNTVRRAFRPVPGSSSEPRIVYLPRIRYLGNPDIERCATELGHDRREHRAHGVRAHLRRCGSPSVSQLFLAQRYGVAVPQGYTFVRPHERGKPLRDIVYRSRSALRCLYETRTEQNVDSTTSQTASPWFQFERDVCDIMRRLGFSVQHVSASRRGDRGVDIYASKGADFDLTDWVIQCKCYSLQHKIGPSVVRELLGALAEYPRGVRGMLVTTSNFSRDAIELAREHDIRLVDGTEFNSLSAKST